MASIALPWQGDSGSWFHSRGHVKVHSQQTVAADGWRHERLQLLQVNPAFEAITLEPEDAGDLTIVGELRQNFILNPPR